MLSDPRVDRQSSPPALAPHAICLDDVIDTSALLATHACDHAAECAAFLALARSLESDPGGLAQRLVDRALDLTQAQSAGLTLEETVGADRVLRWVATSGELAGLEGTLMPRRLSPCGDVLDRQQALVMCEPGRYYPCLSELPCPIARLLLVPFGNGKFVGTIWIAAHDQSHSFDAEHLRIVQDLATFTSGLAAATAMFAAMQDSGKLKQQMLDASELQRKMLASWLQHAPSFLLQLCGPRHVVSTVNDACGELLAGRLVLGLPLAEAVPGCTAQGLLTLLDAVYATARPYVGHGVPIALAGAQQPQTCYLDFVAQPVVENGAVTGIVVQGHDVTEQHRALDHLREADRRKDAFLAMLAHELRNPLAPIKNCTQILRATANMVDTRQERAVRVIERQAATLTRLVDELADLSRIRAGKVSLEFGLVSLQDVVDEAGESSQQLVASRKHRLELVMPHAPLLVHGDRVRLVQITCNLLNNAAKYTPPGGHILVELAPCDDWAVLRVIDTGRGIAPELLPRIFDMFMQVDDARSEACGGLGLGLALVKQLVEMHAGSVEAHSPGLGAGTTLTVRLPLLC